jgi:hypothetical protein
MTIQTQSQPPLSVVPAVAANQILYLFTNVEKDSDGYNVAYRNDSGNTQGCWISIARKDEPKRDWKWAPETAGKVKLFIAPEGGDTARFWMESKLAGVNLNIMSAFVQPGLAAAPEAATPLTSEQRGQSPDLDVDSARTGSAAAYPVNSYPHYRLTSCQVVGNKYIVQYERDLADVGAEDHFYVGLYNAKGERLTWEWARGKSGTTAVEIATGGAYLLYMACFFAVDPANTAFAVSRWNL